MKNVSILTKDQFADDGQGATAKSILTKVAKWTADRDISFKIITGGLIVMLLWAGAYKLTAPGAEGIVPLVSNNPLISWDFKIFGTYVGSDLIGITEITGAILLIVGFFRPKAGIIGSIIGVVMFFTTSTMVITTPGAVLPVNGVGYMTFLGLFLYKDIISLGVSFYLLGHFGRKAIVSENKGSSNL